MIIILHSFQFRSTQEHNRKVFCQTDQQMVDLARGKNRITQKTFIGTTDEGEAKSSLDTNCTLCSVF